MKVEKRTKPLWDGPESDSENGGVTQSLLGRFLCCRERFRLKVVEGIQPVEKFNARSEYGNMWHAVERYQVEDKSLWGWVRIAREYAEGLCSRYRSSQKEIAHWYEVLKLQFPIYLDFWKKNSSPEPIETLLAEQKFNVPYTLPSGRVVRLRGKWDSVDLVGEVKKNKDGVYVTDHKTKSEINREKIERQLAWDLQTLFYLVALQKYNWTGEEKSTTVAKKPFPVRGIRYNVIKRPLSGKGIGGSIRQKKTETKSEFYTRLADIISSNPETFFDRWTVDVTSEEIERFKRECLNPILEQLYDWWELIVLGKEEPTRYHGRPDPIPHWRFPNGITNPLTEGYEDELEDFLRDGSMVGLERTTELFPELR